MATGHCTSYVVPLGTTVRGVDIPLPPHHRDILLNLGMLYFWNSLWLCKRVKKRINPDTLARIFTTTDFKLVLTTWGT